jgi:type II secretory ATPase GspE/PulE/Tfp pilus assembly ATPase PilB-like protein
MEVIRIKFLAGLDSHDSRIPKLEHIRVRHKDAPQFLSRVTMLPTDEGPESIVLTLPTI